MAFASFKFNIVFAFTFHYYTAGKHLLCFQT